MVPNRRRILVVAGEASGDFYGAQLVRELTRLEPALEIHSIGGLAMEAQKPHSHFGIAHFGATGFSGVLLNLPAYIALLGKIHRRIRHISPDLIVFIDNPGLNLRIAKKAAVFKIPMVYYIAPQVWAWGKKRAF